MSENELATRTNWKARNGDTLAKLEGFEMYTSNEKRHFLAGYRAGMLATAEMVNEELCRQAGIASQHECDFTKVIKEAANQVPKE